MSRIPSDKEALKEPVKNARVIHTSGVGRMTLGESFKNVSEAVKRSHWNIFVSESGRDGVPVRVQWVLEDDVMGSQMDGWQLIKVEEVEELHSYEEFTPIRKPFGRPGFITEKNGYLFFKGQFGMWITEARFQANFKAERKMFEDSSRAEQGEQKVERGKATLEGSTEEVEMDLRKL